ncbi:hypothetical protein [Brevundimonas sp.]|uniref:hypothetical protein n=1 Tax=Brevundimonas sp. TaxID=1871086 RepID=UPI002FCA85D3
MRSAWASIIDWDHETRGMAGGMAIAILCLIGGLWWVTGDFNSAGRAARAEVREALGDPGLNVGKPDIRPYPTIDGERSFRTLVCGRIQNDPARPFAVLVKEHRRRHNALQFLGSGDRVERLALPETGPLTPDQAALLDACEGDQQIR